jgi:hypothetical protein
MSDNKVRQLIQTINSDHKSSDKGIKFYDKSPTTDKSQTRTEVRLGDKIKR